MLAAERGFSGLSVPHLKEMAAELWAEGGTGKPPTEKPLVMYLLRMFIKNKTQEEYDALYALRSKSSNLMETQTRLGEKIIDDLGHEVIDEGDKKEIAAAAEECRQLSGISGSGRGGAASSSGQQPDAVGPRPRRTLPAKSHIDLAEARKLLPRAKGCGLTLDVIRHYRWSVEYQTKPEAPKHCSKAFGDESVITRRDALVYVLEWVWGVHTRLTGEPCPWDLRAGDLRV